MSETETVQMEVDDERRRLERAVRDAQSELNHKRNKLKEQVDELQSKVIEKRNEYQGFKKHYDRWNKIVKMSKEDYDIECKKLEAELELFVKESNSTILPYSEEVSKAEFALVAAREELAGFLKAANFSKSRNGHKPEEHK